MRSILSIYLEGGQGVTWVKNVSKNKNREAELKFPVLIKKCSDISWDYIICKQILKKGNPCVECNPSWLIKWDQLSDSKSLGLLVQSVPKCRYYLDWLFFQKSDNSYEVIWRKVGKTSFLSLSKRIKGD